MNILPTNLARKLLPPLVGLVFFLAAWIALIRAFHLSHLLLPSPQSVGRALLGSLPYLSEHASVTLAESFLGFLLGGGIAILLALAFHYSIFVTRALYPYAIGLKAIPLVALAPLVIVWFGTGMASKIVLAAIIAFFPVLVSALQGFSAVEAEALDLMSSLSASRTAVLWKLRLPAALPSIFAGMKVSATFAVIGAVVAEFVSSQAGIGYVVKSSSYYLDTPLTFAAIIVASGIGLLFFGLIAILERIVVFWRRPEESA